jgi:S-phase kinase-associated protein 1
LDLLDKRLDARQLEVRRMISVMEAANFLNNQMLIDELAPLVADHIRGKTPEQIRDMLGLEDDFTEEERREIEKEQAWFLQQDNILN